MLMMMMMVPAVRFGVWCGCDGALADNIFVVMWCTTADGHQRFKYVRGARPLLPSAFSTSSQLASTWRTTWKKKKEREHGAFCLDRKNSGLHALVALMGHYRECFAHNEGKGPVLVGERIGRSALWPTKQTNKKKTHTLLEKTTTSCLFAFRLLFFLLSPLLPDNLLFFSIRVFHFLLSYFAFFPPLILAHRRLRWLRWLTGGWQWGGHGRARTDVQVFALSSVLVVIVIIALAVAPLAVLRREILHAVPVLQLLADGAGGKPPKVGGADTEDDAIYREGKRKKEYARL
jgi:hypothetical protein